MTAPTEAPAPAAPPAATEPPAAPADDLQQPPGPTVRSLWRRSRWYLAGGAVLLVFALLVAGLSGRSNYPPLDPRSGDRNGALAAVRLLQQQGVSFRTVEDPADAAAALREPDTTVVVPLPDLLSHSRLTRLAATRPAAGTRLVLIGAEQPALDAFTPGTTAGEEGADTTDSSATAHAVTSLSTPADCRLPEAVRAGTAELGGLTYRARATDTGCYPRHGRPTLVQRTASDNRDTVVLGTGHPLTNGAIAADGNASLTLGLLGAHRHLVWYLPDYAAEQPSVAHRTLTDYIPDGWSWAALQLGIAALLAAAWRARRLGPVVSEKLPVVVRAAETTEGRARLYERADARGRAADALRRAARHRTAGSLGVPVASGEPDPTALTTAVAARLARPATDVQHLLYGPAPTDDAALLRLTDDLDALERQVRQP